MLENYTLVGQGFRILLKSLSGYIGKEMSQKFGERWWDEVLQALSDQKDLPSNGEYGELIDSLDIANCLRLLKREWYGVFEANLSRNFLTWTNELMGARNVVAHIGQQDLEQPVAERYLNTMLLLCQEIDPDGADEINEVYKKVRSRATDTVVSERVYVGAEQPAPLSPEGARTEGNLLGLGNAEFVQKTTQSRKVTFGGKTQVYPVYRVRLDKLYYNDQNDRIATWITQYESENGIGTLSSLNAQEYNDVIETFICKSNPEAIQKTKNNIALVGQREAGVVLADGRIVDGNRRYTCLRKIERESKKPQYFETVIMEMDIQADRKQIKLLELALQHGEEKKVDYDLIDYAVGTYRDVVQTKLLTVDEYAQSANEPIAEVNGRIEVAKMICEFLDYIKLPEQYHVAREYQVYSLFVEMIVPLKKLNELEKTQLKHIAFNNAIMYATPDQRKFIRDIKKLIKDNAYTEYFAEQRLLEQQIYDLYLMEDIHSKQDIDAFAQRNRDITGKLQLSMEHALQKSRARQMKNKPLDNVVKSIEFLMEVDTRLFANMSPEDKLKIQSELQELLNIVEILQKKISE
ncbi:hypothetical protein H6B33_06170 [Gemmiger formicilis]|uniref:Swt1 family HEPN domain-containing protein n=1 Tax=Gemmiger formicilis TaxID=745368 RepID=UPI00195ECCBE|nr:Swt1 family HEPN domain-containing protein [Gemmiger formicilis]MBM6914986.1 hypothetical protein [Gemmiger formicilis]